VYSFIVAPNRLAYAQIEPLADNTVYCDRLASSNCRHVRLVFPYDFDRSLVVLLSRPVLRDLLTYFTAVYRYLGWSSDAKANREFFAELVGPDINNHHFNLFPAWQEDINNFITFA
jgi:hypothetical protein